MTDQDTQRCVTCGNTKPLKEFRERSNAKGTYARQCKVCRKLVVIANKRSKHPPRKLPQEHRITPLTAEFLATLEAV